MSRFERLDTGVTSPPGGAAGGDLGGTYPAPDVVRITESSGPTSLAIGAIADGEALVRSGATIVSQTIPTLTAIAPVNVSKSTAAVGVGTTAARNDHKHDVDTAAPVFVVAGAGNAEGTSTSLARADHIHGSATAAPIGVSKSPNVEGVSGALARADHKHDVFTASAMGLTPGGGSAEGTATSIARSDHAHALPGFGTGAGTFAQGNDTRIPTQDENDALQGTNGAPSSVNRYVTNSDPRNADARSPTGAASGQLGGTYPGPDVRGMRETLGPTLLTYGNVPDGSVLTRIGATVIGTFPAGTGDVVGPASSTNNHAVVFADATGKLIKEPNAPVNYNAQNITNVGTVDGRDLSADGAKLDTITVANIPTASEKAALAGTDGVPSGINRYVTNSDPRNTDSRTPTGPAGGQLGSTYPNPDVRGLRETAGPTLLTMGALADGDSLTRSGLTLIGATKTQVTASAPVNVTKAAAVVGVSPDAARADHKHDINTAAATGLSIGAASAEGTSTSLSRADHVHAFAAPGAPVDVTKAAASAGASTTAARADHKHDVSTAAAGTISIGDAAAEGVATSLARSDHLHALPAPAAPVNVTKAAASAGASTSPARADHKHDVSTAAPTTNITTGTTNAEGVATTLARSDHSHKVDIPITSVEENADTTTTSATDVQIGALTITPAAGTYLAVFSMSGDRSNNGQWWVSLYLNAGQIVNSERTLVVGAGLDISIHTNAVVTLNGTDAISVRWRTTGGTLTAHQRSLRLIRLA